MHVVGVVTRLLMATGPLRRDGPSGSARANAEVLLGEKLVRHHGIDFDSKMAKLLASNDVPRKMKIGWNEQIQKLTNV